jgi:hypothetical protein
MAYISQEKKKAILESVKKLVKQHDPAIRVTASVRDCCKLRVRLKSDRLLSEQQAYNDAYCTQKIHWRRNQVLHFPDTLNPKTLDLYKQIKNAIHTVGEYYNNSDPMFDYFDYAFYYDCVVA